MRKHLQLINNFQLDQKIRISPVIDQTILHSSPAFLGVQCQSIWEACVNNPRVFVQKATKLLYTCDTGGLCSVSHAKPPFSLGPSQYAATLGHLFALALFALLCAFEKKHFWRKNFLLSKPSFSSNQYVATLRHLFAVALFVLFKEHRKYVGRILYEELELEVFLVFTAILILPRSRSQSKPLLWSRQKPDLGQECRSQGLHAPFCIFKKGHYFDADRWLYSKN